MARTQFSFELKRDCVIVFLGKKKFGTITLSAIEHFFGRGGLKFVRGRQSVKAKIKEVEEVDVPETATQFAKHYFNAMREIPRFKNTEDIVPGDPEFEHFVKAAKIIDRHDVSFKDFLQAQRDGLDFLNEGHGKWPIPGNLGTKNAEMRLIQFLEKGEQGKKGKWVVTKKDKETELTKNERYLLARGRVEDCVATIEEALFVRDLQQLRRGKVEFYVNEYLEVLQD